MRSLKKQIILLGWSLLILALYCLLPQNSQWLRRKILAYGEDFLEQKGNLDLEHRKIERWENEYIYSKQIATYFGHAKRSPTLIVVPPTAYFKERGISYPVPEPAVFYYFTGLKTVAVTSREAIKATWYVHAVQGRIAVDSVVDEKAFRDSINAFLKFGKKL